MSAERNATRGLIDGVGRLALDGVRQAAREHSDDSFADGFNEAANMSTSILNVAIDELLSKIESGGYLTTEEQFLLLKLTRIKSSIERSFFDFWQA